ncbi:DUF4386 family protein [candidate division WOR-3 bacterium]|nr:DUF4386 family protein [candidate division WOR-3 bacterium]
MKNLIANISLRKAAIVAGSAFIISFFLAILVDNFILPNFIIPGGDTAVLANDIIAKARLFNISVILYLIILTLDATIALALYIVLRPASSTLASLTGILRLLYVAIMVIGVLALAFQLINVDSYGTIKLIGYLFFIFHIFVLGYLVFKSGYIPRILGVLLLIASFSYVPAFYLNFPFPKALLLIFMIFMIMGELSLSLWLLLKNAKLREMKS